VLKEPLARGTAEIGVQLHPWVNPPHDEDVNQFNSFAGNLPYELERAKFLKLHETIIRNFGAVPLIYRAGAMGWARTRPRSCARRDCHRHIDPLTFRLFRLGWARLSRSGAASMVGGPGTHVDGAAADLGVCGRLAAMGARLFPALSPVPRMQGVMARLRLLDRIP
jgi:hypothetical protein